MTEETQTNFISGIKEQTLYNTLLNSDRLIGCLWSRDIE